VIDPDEHVVAAVERPGDDLGAQAGYERVAVGEHDVPAKLGRLAPQLRDQALDRLAADVPVDVDGEHDLQGLHLDLSRTFQAMRGSAARGSMTRIMHRLRRRGAAASDRSEHGCARKHERFAPCQHCDEQGRLTPTRRDIVPRSPSFLAGLDGPAAAPAAARVITRE